ncbi:MAG: hypothetical protein Q8M03_13000 [Legionella sp.]|nr:hypothetical protein [Legionella sp.]
MIPINAHDLHVFLICFKDESGPSFYSKNKSDLRATLKSLSGSGYRNDDLSREEKNQLIEAISNYVLQNNVSSGSVDNQMLHEIMVKYLLQYELDYVSNDEVDEFKLTIENYFLKLNQELRLLSPEILNESDFKALLIWLELLTNYPDEYIRHMWVHGNGNDYYLNSLELSECGCIDTSHDRLFGNVRLQVEKFVLEACEIANSSVDDPLKLLSMGPGGALQDFVIIFKLLTMGIRHIELTLLEPEYECLLGPISEITRKIYCRNLPEGSPLPEKYYVNYQKKIYSIIRAISLLNRRFEDATINIYQYHSLENLKQDVKIVAPYDIVYAIDFDDYEIEGAKTDFHETANYLKPGGRAILSVHNQIMLFTTLQNNNEYMEINSVEFDSIQPDGEGYHQKNDNSSFFH